MKTAISLPDDLFEKIDARARTLKVSRSALIARAARAYLESDAAEDATQQWDRAAALMASAPAEQGFAHALERETARVVRKATPKPSRKR